MIKLNQLGKGPKGKIKTNQNSPDSSSHYLIIIDSTKQL
jgi:hypothetical protein